MQITLTNSEANLLLNALREAHEVYERCANDTDTTFRIADQFRRQMAETTALAERIEAAI